MDGQKIVNEIGRKLNGEFEVIEVDSDDWNTYVSALNENIDLYNKMGKWRTSYNPNYILGTVSTDTQYKIKRGVVANISGAARSNVLFTDTDGVVLDKYKIVDQDIFDAADSGSGVATINSLGLQIKAKTASNRIFGANIVIPAYIAVKPVTGTDSTVVTDDNYWLITKTAADLASTSPVSFIARNYDDLNTQATARLRDMKKANRISQGSRPAYGGWNPLTGPVDR